MTISVTGKINEAAKEFPNDKGVSFLIKIGVQEYDRKAGAKVWVNYSGFAFSSNENQINFYRQSLLEGSIVELSGSGVIPEVYGDQNRVTLLVQEAKLGYIGTTGAAAPQQQAAPAPQQYQQAPPQAAPQQQYQQASAAPQQQYQSAPTGYVPVNP